MKITITRYSGRKDTIRKVINSRPSKVTLVEFADMNGLEIEICERYKLRFDPRHNNKYYAHFKGVDVKDGCMLCGVVGDGATPKAAIRSYMKRISKKELVICGYGNSRREFQVPTLTEIGLNKSDEDKLKQ